MDEITNKKLSKGLFISFEGPDGSGKSTQVIKLKNYLSEHGFNVVMTREPGGTPISEKIRGIILDSANKELSPMTEAFLYAASRAQLVDELIKPSLKDGCIVISDRFVDSSIAYQGYARMLGDCVSLINGYAVRDTMPDITFLLALDPAIGLNRVRSSRQALDRLEQEKIDFHNRVYEAFLKIAEQNADRFVVIDADRSEEEIAADIIRKVSERIASLRE